MKPDRNWIGQGHHGRLALWLASAAVALTLPMAADAQQWQHGSGGGSSGGGSGGGGGGGHGGGAPSGGSQGASPHASGGAPTGGTHSGPPSSVGQAWSQAIHGSAPAPAASTPSNGGGGQRQWSGGGGQQHWDHGGGGPAPQNGAGYPHDGHGQNDARGDWQGNNGGGGPNDGHGDWRDHDGGRDHGGWRGGDGDRRGFGQTYWSQRRFHVGGYRRPDGWYAHRWGIGEILPPLFWGEDYWIDDFDDYGLPPPPYGYVWVRYGDDALLIDQNTGEVAEVMDGVFY